MLSRFAEVLRRYPAAHLGVAILITALLMVGTMGTARLVARVSGHSGIRVPTPTAHLLGTAQGGAQLPIPTARPFITAQGPVFMAHAFFNTMSWCVLVPLAVDFSRFRKRRDPLWFFKHRFLAGTAGLVSLLTFFGNMLAVTGVFCDNLHCISGFIFTGLVVLQLVFGALANALFNPLRKKVPIWPDRIHGILGATLLVYGFFQVGTGFSMHFREIYRVVITGLLTASYFAYRFFRVGTRPPIEPGRTGEMVGLTAKEGLLGSGGDVLPGDGIESNLFLFGVLSLSFLMGADVIAHW